MPPMPSASVAIASADTSGLRRIWRIPCAASRAKCSSLTLFSQRGFEGKIVIAHLARRNRLRLLTLPRHPPPVTVGVHEFRFPGRKHGRALAHAGDLERAAARPARDLD